VGKGPRSIRRNDAPNTMERCACSMPPASLTVAPVPCVSPVKNTAPPPKNLAMSALSCIPCLSLRQKSRRPWALLLLPLQFIPSCGGLVTHAASPSLDPVAAQPPGHRASSTQFTTCPHACCFLARRASALAYDVATTARTQYATKERPACQDYRVWALIRLCPDARFASRLSYCVLLTKLILDLDSPVERIRLLIFALCFR